MGTAFGTEWCSTIPMVGFCESPTGTQSPQSLPMLGQADSCRSKGSVFSDWSDVTNEGWNEDDPVWVIIPMQKLRINFGDQSYPDLNHSFDFSQKIGDGLTRE